MIGIIDYDAGNIRSVANALHRLNVPYIITNNKKELSRISKIILPGVGEARSAMNSLRSVNLLEWLRELNIPFLGICLGMQILFERSAERETQCLGIIPGIIQRFERLESGLKVPHMGWNQVNIKNSSLLFTGINSGEFFYFVHSYFAPTVSTTIGETDYGIRFTSAIQNNNYYGVQFHPEKSGKIGLQILKNFVELC